MPKQKEQFEEMRQQTIARLKKSGLELFARKGLAATNIKEIAAHTGISLGLMYHYYSSKEELYLLLANEAMDKSQALFDQLQSQDISVKEKITQFLAAFMYGVQKEAGIYYFILISQLFETGNKTEDRKLRTRKLQSIHNLATIVSEGQQTGECVTGDPFELAVTFIAATQGLAGFKLMFKGKFQMPDAAVLTRILLQA
ncbi:TetR/AcrR family transcriptional regulator [Chitinophaga nivalis]|uniref:TetR/AcrR family transcriptional regulator n=1 Tax=Chitinophaga nivalis TaxID=2991709 RepID=A0ABT3IQS0_9BACT|nr:TetR/AcrR family transcriptional regulator [Chitinophaga nivalis]MCW3464012.1 TetR/AcrR family transcriptional regulator [Chitinophaga nivalis]MCW3486298.1 TetR/AcrR family transcriptional regulator [Chitinophaga nivalis]